MNLANEMVIQIVRDYDGYLDFISEQCGYSLERVSYSRWVIGELLRRLKFDESTPPLTVLEDFLEKMHDYSKMNKDFAFIFSVAHDVTEDIIDGLLS